MTTGIENGKHGKVVCNQEENCAAFGNYKLCRHGVPHEKIDWCDAPCLIAKQAFDEVQKCVPVEEC